MIINTLFEDIVYSTKEKKVKSTFKREKREKREYVPPVYIGQNLYIKPNYIVSIPEFHSDNKVTSVKNLENQKNLKDNKRKGRLSRKSIQNLRNSINWLCIAAKKKYVYDKKKNKSFFFKVNFITLTLPDTDKPITSNDLQNNLLNPFLTYLRKFYDLNNYIWRLEFQANGKLHVHIVTDMFLNLRVIKEGWNNLLDKNGYLENFYKENGHKQPNSTDIHATKKIKNMAAYLSKYMSKKNSFYFEKEKAIIEKLKVESTYKDEKKLKAFEVKLRKSDNFFKENGIRGNFALKNGWYMQRLNFWNSNFNPRPITGRIWSCNYELSKAGKLTLHIPSTDCKEDLRCLMTKNIEYKEIFTKAPEQNVRYKPEDPRNMPKKIGEVYFLKAKDWIDKMSGEIKKAFFQVRNSLSSSGQVNFVLDY